jgi:hypothetical protein
MRVCEIHASKRHAYETHTLMIAREMHGPVRYTTVSFLDLSRIGAGKITTPLVVKSVMREHSGIPLTT